MDIGEYRGRKVQGFLATDDASTAVEVKLRDINFDGTNFVSLTVGQRLAIDTVVIANGDTAAVVTLFHDANDNGTVDTGDEILSASLGAKAQLVPNLGTQFVCRRVAASGVTSGKIKIKASAASANTRVYFSGTIVDV
jgi:hypothetical protein